MKDPEAYTLNIFAEKNQPVLLLGLIAWSAAVAVVGIFGVFGSS